MLNVFDKLNSDKIAGKIKEINDAIEGTFGGKSSAGGSSGSTGSSGSSKPSHSKDEASNAFHIVRAVPFKQVAGFLVKLRNKYREY